MLEALKLFDAYGLKARLFPAVVVALPVLALTVVLVPWNTLGLPHAIAVLLGAVLLFALADVARRQGRRVQQKLGTGATPELMFRGELTIDEFSKDRYRAFMSEKLKALAPTKDDEAARPELAMAFYNSAGNWLREHTRDKRRFSVLQDELITYGYRRNLLGLKPLSLVMNALVLTGCILIAFVKIPYASTINAIGPKALIIGIAALLHSVYMLLAVGPTGVREASKVYGRQLVLSCETLMTAARPAR